MVDPSAGKRSAATAAADLVESGMRIGLGTGSTVRFALERLAARIAEGLELAGVPTSRATERAARALRIPLIDLESVESLDLAIDGADEVDGRKNLIKGGGGALVREKIVAAAARELVVVVDEGKMVARLGAVFPLPVEVMAFGWRQCLRAVQALGCEPELRRAPDGRPFVTDNGNYVLDCKFASIDDPPRLHDALNAIAGVVDNGLFVNLAGRVFVGNRNGEVRQIP